MQDRCRHFRQSLGTYPNALIQEANAQAWPQLLDEVKRLNPLINTDEYLGALFEPAAEPAEVAEVAFTDSVRVDQHAA